MDISNNIRTRFLIISDTHGMEFITDKKLQHVDVAIHCGDLTDESKIEEFRTTIQLLKNIDAPLKLVIAGNHDFTMDIPVFKEKVADLEARQPGESKLAFKIFGDYGEARQLFEEAGTAGIILLDEGIHRFNLRNGALLTVYASPYTPTSSVGDWGFQYHRDEKHDFAIKKDVDIVITHGPPKGIMDYTGSSQRGGCSTLFEAVARARPRLHCFGHIHEGWGAKLITWRDKPSETPSHFTDIDNERSVLVEKLSTLKLKTPEAKLKMEKYIREGCCTTSHCTGDPNPLEFNSQTLFVNAAIKGMSDNDPAHLPWLVDIELPKG
jgi:Icc-related predicted phosphoesterase